MSDEFSIAALIGRVRQGDESAREELFTRYRPYLRLLAEMQLGRRLRGKCEASDLVQQSLLEAHRDFTGFTGTCEGELLAWLRHILAHNLYNEARYHKAQKRASAREVSLEQVRMGLDSSSLSLAGCLAAGTPSPSSAAVQHENAVSLAEALSHLPEDYRTVLQLRIFEGMPAEDTARTMQRSTGAVRMLQLRALTALREEMKKMEGNA